MKRVFELATSGADEYLQGIGSDPFGGSSSFGLRVPNLTTPDKDHRYLFLLASFTLGEGACARIVGYRQFSSLGFVIAPGRFVEQEITSPNFRLPDGNISWHIKRLGPPNAEGYPHIAPTPLDLNSFKRGWTDGPALLYHDYTIAPGNRIYTQILSYNPPNRGQPWGTPLTTGHQGNFFDQRTPWREAHAWSSLNMVLEGPDTIAFFASVRQSSGNYTVAASPLAFGNGLSEEEQFIGNFGGGDILRPKYWRVGGSLIVEYWERPEDETEPLPKNHGTGPMVRT
jgi:hypothetical protein